MITIVLGFFAFFLVSCGKKETITYKDLETEIQNAQLEKTRNALRTYLLVPEETRTRRHQFTPRLTQSSQTKRLPTPTSFWIMP